MSGTVGSVGQSMSAWHGSPSSGTPRYSDDMRVRHSTWPCGSVASMSMSCVAPAVRRSTAVMVARNVIGSSSGTGCNSNRS